MLKKAAKVVAIGRLSCLSDASIRDKGAVDFTSYGGGGERETAGNPRLDVRWPGDRPRRKEGAGDKKRFLSRTLDRTGRRFPSIVSRE